MRLSRIFLKGVVEGFWGPRALIETPDQAPVATRATRPDLAPNYWVAHAGLPVCGSVPPTARSAARSFQLLVAGLAQQKFRQRAAVP